MTPVSQIINEVVQSMRVELNSTYPVYEYGRMEYVSNKITESINRKESVFPLIVLVMDFKEDFSDGLVKVTVPIIFFTNTTPHKSNDQRYTDTFPTLYDLLDLFQKELGKHEKINTSYPEYNKIDSAYYKGRFNVLNDNTDVVACEFDLEIVQDSECEYVAPTTFDLVLTAETGGTTAPIPGTYTENSGTYKAFYADVSDGYEFSYWLINGQQFTDNPIEYRYLSNGTMQAVFTSLGGVLTPQVKVFDSAPVLKGNRYFFGDHSTKDSDVLVKNVKAGAFSVTDYVETGLQFVGQSAIDFTCYHYQNISAINRFLLFTKSTTATVKGLLIYIPASGNISVAISNGTNQQLWSPAYIQQNKWHKIQLIWNGLIGGTITLIVNDVTYTTAATHEWTGNAAFPISIGGRTSNGANGLISYCKFTGNFEYVFNHGQGALVYDISGNGNNGTITGAVLATFWGTNSDEAYPYDLTLGATLYQKDSDSTIMPICFNTSQAITGFTRLGWFPAGSGILRGLVNKYNIPVSVPGMPAGDYTEAEIRALIPSTNIIKTETTNTISLLEGRVIE